MAAAGVSSVSGRDISTQFYPFTLPNPAPGALNRQATLQPHRANDMAITDPNHQEFLAESPTVLVLSASHRPDSYNRKLALLAAEAISAHGGEVDFAEMGEFDAPSFDPRREKEGDIPPQALDFQRRLESNDAFVIASPEYNFSFPGYLKNSIDWVSRLRPQPFQARHGLLMSASPSMVGGNRGLWALRIPLEHLGSRVFPEMFSLAQSDRAFSDDGKLKDDRLSERFRGSVQSFMDLVEANKKYPCAKKAWIEFLGEKLEEADPG